MQTGTLLALIGFAHTYFYMPYHREKLLSDPYFKKMVTDRVDKDFREFKASELSFELKLSEETGIPLYKIPRKIAGVVKLADSAKALYPEINNAVRIIPIGIILNGKRIMYVDHRGRFRYPEEDSVGYYRFLNNGKKHYLYYK